MQALVLCGGRGTRAYPLTVDVPKPLLEVAGRPLLQHLVEIFTRHGVTDFVLAAGFRADAVADFAATLTSVSATVVDTGLDTGTGGRISACLPKLDDVFIATYGDGLGSVDIAALVARHHEHGRGATITTVPLPSQYGTLELGPGDAVQGFQEKPVLADHWINAGFLVFDKAVWEQHAGEDLERDVLPSLAHSGALAAYRHSGFWKSMDTYKDQQALEELAACDPAPWLA